MHKDFANQRIVFTHATIHLHSVDHHIFVNKGLFFFSFSQWRHIFFPKTRTYPISTPLVIVKISYFGNKCRILSSYNTPNFIYLFKSYIIKSFYLKKF